MKTCFNLPAIVTFGDKAMLTVGALCHLFSKDLKSSYVVAIRSDRYSYKKCNMNFAISYVEDSKLYDVAGLQSQGDVDKFSLIPCDSQHGWSWPKAAVYSALCVHDTHFKYEDHDLVCGHLFQTLGNIDKVIFLNTYPPLHNMIYWPIDLKGKS